VTPVDPDLKRLQQEILSAIAEVSPEQWSWHPPGKWCAAEVIEHLYLSYTGTIKGFERVIAAGKSLAAVPSWKQRAGAFLIFGLGYFPSGREAPAVARPRGVPQEKVLAEIGPKIAEMDEIIQRCEEKFEARKKLLDHPILGPMSAGEWRKLHLLHGLHHVKQIRRLREGGDPGLKPA